MYSAHWYSCCWLSIFFFIIIWRRIFWINRWTSKFWTNLDRYIWTTYLKQETVNLFSQDIAFNLTTLVVIIASNTLTLTLFPDPSMLKAVTQRIGPLVLINMNILFLLSFRHSIFIELAAAYQPEFLWAHQAFGSITITEAIVYCGLKFRG